MILRYREDTLRPGSMQCCIACAVSSSACSAQVARSGRVPPVVWMQAPKAKEHNDVSELPESQVRVAT